MLDKPATPIATADPPQNLLQFVPRAPPTEPEPSEDFAWLPDNLDIAIVAQPATAVYLNAYGSIVIRQENTDGDDEDPFIMIAPQNLRALITRLEKFASREVI